ncbi:MAG: hypothetical protein J6T32_03735 [Paludibacteraceae bacterium]|jgi:hypothetical protein|nr:hypothetical protein [Paludibacteraceae bacterium]
MKKTYNKPSFEVVDMFSAATICLTVSLTEGGDTASYQPTPEQPIVGQ